MLGFVSALVPDGPLHPREAVLGVLAGLLVAVVARRRPTWWVGGVGLAWVFLVIHAQGSALPDAFAARPVVAIAILVAGGAGGAWLPLPNRVIVAASFGSAATWAVVPDTEAPLLAVMILTGAAVAVPGSASRFTGAVLGLPLASALVGSAARPDRMWSASAVIVAVVVLVAVPRPRGQRAGTPTTVAPGGTSSTTTAPAPTTAC